VVTGKINGGAPGWSDYLHSNRDTSPLGDYDTLIPAMDASKYGDAQTTVSSADSNPPAEEDFTEAFEGTGNYSTQYHPDVSSLISMWS